MTSQRPSCITIACHSAPASGTPLKRSAKTHGPTLPMPQTTISSVRDRIFTMIALLFCTFDSHRAEGFRLTIAEVDRSLPGLLYRLSRGLRNVLAPAKEKFYGPDTTTRCDIRKAHQP